MRRARLRFVRWMTSNLEASPRPHCDAGQRAVREVHGDLGLVADALVEALQERTAAGEHDAAVHDVGCELGRRLVERRLHRIDDHGHRLVEGTPTSSDEMITVFGRPVSMSRPRTSACSSSGNR